MTSLSTAMGKEDLHSVWSHVCMCYFSVYLVCVPVLTHVFFHKHEVVRVLKKKKKSVGAFLLCVVLF